MAEHRMLRRMVLLLLAMLGCLCGFVGLMVSAGAVLQRLDKEPVFVLSNERGSISLPCRVEGTDLIACQLVMYEGPSLENGSDAPVSDITALVLYNDGQQEVAQAEVKLTAEEELTFFASNIMPGAQVLVLEKNVTAWKDREITACTGWVSAADHPTLSAQALEIAQVDMGTLSVTNTTGEKLTDIWLFYKNYLPEGDLYVGGITYIETIEALEPGQTVLIQPTRYAAGYSKVIKAEIIA